MGGVSRLSDHMRSPDLRLLDFGALSVAVGFLTALFLGLTLSVLALEHLPK